MMKILIIIWIISKVTFYNLLPTLLDCKNVIPKYNIPAESEDSKPDDFSDVQKSKSRILMHTVKNLSVSFTEGDKNTAKALFRRL